MILPIHGTLNLWIMENKPIAIRINGMDYSHAELYLLISEKLADDHLPDWQTEFYAFLKEWFSTSNTISAQTSGSTGSPQQIHLPKDVMEQSALRTIEYFQLKEGNRLLLSLPCRFIAGKMMVVRAIVGKMNLVTIDPSLESDILLNHTFDLGAMVPNQVYKLMESLQGKEKLENIRHLLIGGSSIQANLEEQLIGLKNHVVSTYGMTETASHIAIRGLSGQFRSEVYECLPGITVALDELDCLQIQVPGHEAFHTKDMAEVLSPTSFKILGRADDVIISGGIKYFPENIEKKLDKVFVQRFVISSLPDDQLVEKLVLVIEGEMVDTDILQKKIIPLLLPFERPKEIYFVPIFPETKNGKIKRKEIKKMINDCRLTIND